MDTYQTVGWEAALEDLALPEAFNVVDALVERHRAEGRGGQVAVYCGDHALTFDELAALVNQIGHGLQSQGLAPEQRVALWLPDGPELLATLLAAMRLGAVPVPLNTLATAEELAFFLNDSRPMAAVVDPHGLARLETIQPPPRWPELVVLVGGAYGGRQMLAELMAGFLGGPTAPPSASTAASPWRLVAFADLVAGRPTTPLPVVTHRDDVAYWIYSSATTGRPKAIVHLHGDTLYGARAFGAHVLGLTPADRCCATSRLFLGYGIHGLLYWPLWAGSSVILTPEWPTAASVLATIARHQPTVLFSSPTFYAQLLTEWEARAAPPDLGPLRLCVTGGEALPTGLYERWRAVTGRELLNAVGASEVGTMFLSNYPGRSRPGTVGELLPGMGARLVDADGAPVPPGAVGELWVASRSNAARYWHQADLSRATFVGPWYRTGDTYYQDEAGHYVFTGRRDDLLRVGGHWVSPLELEDVLRAHPAVAEVVVVGGADGRGRTVPHALVVPATAPPPADLAAALQVWVAARLPPPKRLHGVEFVAALPRTAAGKLRRYKLRGSAEGSDGVET